MTDDETDRLALAKALSTQAGMLFEDASSLAILVRDQRAEHLRQTLWETLTMNMRAGVLLEAAVSLLAVQEQVER